MKIKSNYALIALVLFVLALYHKLFIFGQIPFPGDLLVNGYSPWFDYYHMPTQNPLISDVFSQLYLWKMLAIESFKNLQWPLWNPYSMMGTPLMANLQSSTLYPLNILLLLSKFGWGLFIFSQTLIAALTMYLLLSHWKLALPARFLGAVVFSVSGLMTTWLELGTSVHGMAWLPLSIYSISAYFQTFRIRYFLLLVLSLTFSSLAGNPQVIIYVYSVSGLFILFNLFQNPKQLIKNLPILLAFVLSGALAAPQLLTSMDLLSNSIRSSESYTSEYNFGLLPFLDFIKFFSADVFGSPITRNYWGFLNYFETSGFVGTLSVALIIYAFIYLRKNKLIFFFLGLYIVSILLSFSNPLSVYLYSNKIPLLTQSYASRMLFVTTFSSAILISFALDQIIKLKDVARLMRSILWLLAGLVGIAAAFYQLQTIYFPTIIAEIPEKIFNEFFSQDPWLKLDNYSVLLKNIALPILICSVSVGAYIISYLFKNKFPTQQLFIYLIILITVVDVGRYFLKFTPFVPADLVFPSTPAIEFLQQQPGHFRIGRDHAEILPPNTWTAYGLSSLEGYDPIYLDDYGKFMHFLNSGDLNASSSRYAEFTGDYGQPFLDTTNTKYFIAVGRDNNGIIPGDLINYKFNEAKYRKVFQDKSAVILENPGASERVFFAEQVQIVTDQQAKEIVTQNKTFNPLKTALLTKDLNIATTSGQGRAEITHYTPNKVTIKTTTEKDEILILADAYDKNWTAFVDSQPTDISKANLILRAVKVPAGEHTITFEYWPKSFAQGLWISGITLLGLLILSLYSYRNKIF